MEGIVHAEWDRLKKVFIHRPGIEMFFGLLNPSGSLYERPFSREQARKEHEILENALKTEFQVEVFRLRETILKAVDEDPLLRLKLIDLAKEAIEMTGNKDEIDKVLQRIDHDAKYLDAKHFFNILILNPGFNVSGAEDQSLMMNLSHHLPLANLYFMRDQQFMTNKGIILSNLSNDIRKKEVKLTKFLWEEVLKIPIFYEMQPPATIEGGEFIPMGNYALIGIGSRTNRSAIDQLLRLPFDYEEIAIVHQPMHPLVPSDKPDPMINMHLDTYFNVAGKDIAVGCELLLKEAKVEVYYKESRGYVKEPKDTTFDKYLKKKKVNLINITTLEQMSYASNFLCIEDKKILAIEVEQGIRDILTALEQKVETDPARYGKLYHQAKEDYEKLKKEAQFFPHKKEIYSAGIECYPVILKNLTGGFGGAHCMTCALEREEEKERINE